MRLQPHPVLTAAAWETWVGMEGRWSRRLGIVIHLPEASATYKTECAASCPETEYSLVTAFTIPNRTIYFFLNLWLI